MSIRFSKPTVSSKNYSLFGGSESHIKKLRRELNTPYNSIIYPIKSVSTQLSLKQFVGYSLFMIPLALSLASGVHEVSHAIFVLLFGGRVFTLVVFPYNFLLIDGASRMGYVMWFGNFNDTQTAIVCMAGSTASIFWAVVILWVMWRKQYNPLVELLAFWCVLLFSVDATYPLVDLLSFHSADFGWWFTDVSGDWYKTYQLVPWMQYVAPTISVIWLVFLTILFRYRKASQHFEF